MTDPIVKTTILEPWDFQPYLEQTLTEDCPDCPWRCPDCNSDLVEGLHDGWFCLICGVVW